MKKQSDLDELAEDLISMWIGDEEILPVWLSRSVVVSLFIVLACLLILTGILVLGLFA